MNSEPWLEVTWVRNSWESSRELMESWVGMKRDCLVRQSTITNIAVCPSNVRSCSMKSIEMDSHGCGGIGSFLRKPYSLCWFALEHAHTVQYQMYYLTIWVSLGQWNAPVFLMSWPRASSLPVTSFNTCRK